MRGMTFIFLDCTLSLFSWNNKKKGSHRQSLDWTSVRSSRQQQAVNTWTLISFLVWDSVIIRLICFMSVTQFLLIYHWIICFISCCCVGNNTYFLPARQEEKISPECLWLLITIWVISSQKRESFISFQDIQGTCFYPSIHLSIYLLVCYTSIRNLSMTRYWEMDMRNKDNDSKR